jgi:hypothetical protein
MLAAAGLLFHFASPAQADSFTVSSSASILWDTLRIATGPGVSITWLGTSDETQVLHLRRTKVAGVGFIDSQTVANRTTNSESFSYYNQFGGASTTAKATASTVSGEVVWTDPPSGLSDLLIGRHANFQVNGSGTVTFAVDYALAASRSIDASSLHYPRISAAAGSQALLQLYIPFVAGFAIDEDFLTLPSSEGSAHDSVSRRGTARLQYDFARGGTYWIRADAGASVSVIVPEPASRILFVFGLAATILASRLRLSHQKARPPG